MATIIECLDELKPGDDYSLLVSGTVACWSFHPECGHVFNSFRTKDRAHCDSCGRACGIPEMLFEQDEGRFLEMIFENYLSRSSKPLCITLFCTLMEQHFRNFFVSRCRRLNVDWLIIESLIAGVRRKDDQFRLFKKLTGCSHTKAISQKGTPNFFQGYRSLHEKRRNDLVHGKTHSVWMTDDNDVKQAVELAVNSFSVFAYLHGECCSISAPSMRDLEAQKLSQLKA
jgi:hypothetical protein